LLLAALRQQQDRFAPHFIRQTSPPGEDAANPNADGASSSRLTAHAVRVRRNR
jgi:hypothetical protein